MERHYGGVGGSVKKGVKLVGRVCAQKRLTILGGAVADFWGGSPHLEAFCSNPASPLQSVMSFDSWRHRKVPFYVYFAIVASSTGCNSMSEGEENSGCYLFKTPIL